MPNRIDPIVLPTINVPDPPTRGMTVPVTRGLKPPKPLIPVLQYPQVDFPTTVPTEVDDGKGGKQEPEPDTDMDRPSLPIPDFFGTYDPPPPPGPSVNVPGVDYQLPIPETAIMVTAGTTAAVATAGALAATTALKPMFEFLVKQFKTIFKIAVNKILNKKPPDFSKVPSQPVSLPDQFHFSSGRLDPVLLRQHKPPHKGKKDEEKPHPESSQRTSKPEPTDSPAEPCPPPPSDEQSQP